MPVPAPTTRLFEGEDLAVPLGRTVTDAVAEHAERIVWGWLKTPLGLAIRPDEVPDEVYAWAVELGAIYIENPTGLASEELGPAKKAYSSERRAALLLEAGAGLTTTALRPGGSFPAAQRYPDPAF